VNISGDWPALWFKASNPRNPTKILLQIRGIIISDWIFFCGFFDSTLLMEAPIEGMEGIAV